LFFGSVVAAPAGALNEWGVDLGRQMRQHLHKSKVFCFFFSKKKRFLAFC
jgi:hypothetical protein